MQGGVCTEVTFILEEVLTSHVKCEAVAGGAFGVAGCAGVLALVLPANSRLWLNHDKSRFSSLVRPTMPRMARSFEPSVHTNSRFVFSRGTPSCSWHAHSRLPQEHILGSSLFSLCNCWRGKFHIFMAAVIISEIKFKDTATRRVFFKAVFSPVLVENVRDFPLITSV